MFEVDKFFGNRKSRIEKGGIGRFYVGFLAMCIIKKVFRKVFVGKFRCG